MRIVGFTVSGVDPKTPASPALASLERARARQQVALRWLQPLGFVVVAVVLVAGSAANPHPGTRGDRLGVLLALAGFLIGSVGVILPHHASAAAQAPLFAVLIASSTVLVWLQPGGAGLLGFFLAVSAAATRMGGRMGAATAAAAVIALAVAGAAGPHQLARPVILTEVGVLAFYLLAVFANRLRQGQDQAERLLIELEQTRAAHAHAAALAERQRLAREMHDVLAHSLSGLVLQLEGARLLASERGADPQLADAVERAHHLAKAGLSEARQAISMLRDDQLPGPDRLHILAREFERDRDVHCEVMVTGEVYDLGPQARLTLYRGAQEALTNIGKHARPERVELHLDYEPTGTRLTIEDFGQAVGPPQPAGDSGYGLTGMRERAELLGGTLTAAPTGSGFRVELWMPK